MKVRLFILAVFLVGAICAAAEECKQCDQYPNGQCYCKVVPQGYKECSVPEVVGNCEYCIEGGGQCPNPGGGGGGGGWVYSGGPFVNLDDGSPCSGNWWCPPECARCW